MSIPWITEELRGGAYYGRWIEANDSDSRRLACSCGYHSTWWESGYQLRQSADELHRRH